MDRVEAPVTKEKVTVFDCQVTIKSKGVKQTFNLEQDQEGNFRLAQTGKEKTIPVKFLRYISNHHTDPWERAEIIDLLVNAQDFNSDLFSIAVGMPVSSRRFWVNEDGAEIQSDPWKAAPKETRTMLKIGLDFEMNTAVGAVDPSNGKILPVRQS